MFVPLYRNCDNRVVNPGCSMAGSKAVLHHDGYVPLRSGLFGFPILYKAGLCSTPATFRPGFAFPWFCFSPDPPNIHHVPPYLLPLTYPYNFEKKTCVCVCIYRKVCVCVYIRRPLKRGGFSEDSFSLHRPPRPPRPALSILLSMRLVLSASCTGPPTTPTPLPQPAANLLVYLEMNCFEGSPFTLVRCFEGSNACENPRRSQTYAAQACSQPVPFSLKWSLK